MCPACITTAALLTAGAASTGGLIALAVRKGTARIGLTGLDATRQTGGEQDDHDE